MATHYSSGQYEDAFVAQNLQNWSLPRVCQEHPTAREGYTQFIGNDRGHLLPSVPRSKASPWGTYMGTWDMPLKIPPAKVNLTSRSVAAAAHLTDWINKSTALASACNGLCPQIMGKASDSSASLPKESSAKRSRRPSSKGPQHPRSADKLTPQEEAQERGAPTPKGPLSRQPGSIDVRLNEGSSSDTQVSQQTKPRDRASSEIPLSRQPGCMDVRLKDASSPKMAAPSRPSSRESTPRRAISAEAPPSVRPRSLEAKPKGLSTPELLASYRPTSMEANPRSTLSPEALASNRPSMKGNHTAEVPKVPAGLDAERKLSKSALREGSTVPPLCPEETSN